MLTSQTIPLKEKWAKVDFTIFWLKCPSLSGFLSLNDEIRRNGYQIGYELTERKKFKHQSLRKQYKSYKESYVKHLQFNPIKPTLSMFSFIKKKSGTFLFQLLCWSTLLWRKSTFSLTRRPMMRLRRTSGWNEIVMDLFLMYFLGIYWYAHRYKEINKIKHIFLFILPGDNWGPAWLDWRHHGPPHWFLNSQWGWDYLLYPEVLQPWALYPFN